ncbi:MotA/TolQ/ExbB proton channel family protein [Rubellicoccus peritrichatus]|uniref:MotA/TolQ/ExbB proton channel family protein n=1 Tax=Rubellicoccus peritrichatus TaxID=3080537 RepID=A0AAQ3LC06_9BACT|nr:MotA/TolQ/ExbB proton channel family protein [Puniceicoccus sp. CR14]WOO39364.1 MotA/TolQ/ExbB proton channel family protein [Puniceicoccus sp. CR14]
MSRFILCRSIFTFLILPFLVPLAYGQDTSEPETEIVVLEASEVARIDWLSEIAKGGVTALALLLVGIAGIAFFLERLISVRKARILPMEQAKEVRGLWKDHNFDGAAEAVGKSRSIYAQVVTYLARHIHLPYDVLSLNVSDLGGRLIREQMQKCYPLAVIATISPLLGLLGTIIGMIESFQKVALMGDTGDASVLADSIGKALITTAIGLVIAIPALAAYHYFRSRLNKMSLRLEEETDELLSVWLADMKAHKVANEPSELAASVENDG